MGLKSSQVATVILATHRAYITCKVNVARPCHGVCCALLAHTGPSDIAIGTYYEASSYNYVMVST